MVKSLVTHNVTLDTQFIAIRYSLQNNFDFLIQRRFKGELYKPMFVAQIPAWDILYSSLVHWLGEKEAQYFNCNTCKRFVEEFGGCFFLGKDYNVYPVMFSQVNNRSKVGSAFHAAYAEVIRAIGASIERGAVRLYSRKKKANFDASLGSFEHIYIYGLPQFSPDIDGTETVHDLADSLIRSLREKLHTDPDWYDALENTIRRRPLAVHRSLKQYEEIKKLADIILKDSQQFHASKHITNFRLLNQLVHDKSEAEVMGLLHFNNSVGGKYLEDCVKKGATAAAASFRTRVSGVNYMRPKAPAKDGNIRHADKKMQDPALQSAITMQVLGVDDFQHCVKFGSTKEVSFFWPRLRQREFLANYHPHTVEDLLRLAPNIRSITLVRYQRRVDGGTSVDPFGMVSQPTYFAGPVDLSTAGVIYKHDSVKERDQQSTWRFVHPNRTQVESGEKGKRVYCLARVEGNWYPVLRSTSSVCVPTPLFAQKLLPEFYDIRSTLEEYASKTKVIESNPAVGCLLYNCEATLNVELATGTQTMLRMSL